MIGFSIPLIKFIQFGIESNVSLSKIKYFLNNLLKDNLSTLSLNFLVSKIKEFIKISKIFLKHNLNYKEI